MLTVSCLCHYTTTNTLFGLNIFYFIYMKRDWACMLQYSKVLNILTLEAYIPLFIIST